MKISKELAAAFERRYPGKQFFYLPDQENPEEIVCELERDPEGRFSTAVALIGASKPHVHHKTHEAYFVLSGELDIYHGSSAGLRYAPKDGFHKIMPFTPHSAVGVGGPAEVLVIAVPAWTKEDHIL